MEWIDSKKKETLPPALIAEWDKWLDDNFDPGHYDPWKDKGVIPSVMRCDVYCPEHIRAQVNELLTTSP